MLRASLNTLSLLYQAQGRYADAEQLYKRSLAIQEKVFGPDYPDIAAALNGLASLYQAQARYADAESLVQEVIGNKRRSLLAPITPMLRLR